jgi:hypothetical protein
MWNASSRRIANASALLTAVAVYSGWLHFAGEIDGPEPWISVGLRRPPNL